MAKDAEVWLVFLEERSSFFRHLPAFIQKMTDGEAAACRFDHGLRWKATLPYPSIFQETAGRLDTTMLREDHKLAQFGRTIN